MPKKTSIKQLYSEIRKYLFYMIPEKWNKIYLYASIIQRENGEETGEMFFYYFPKGILKKNPINVYEIPNRFNLNEEEYIKLVEKLYKQIKKIWLIFKKANHRIWTNLTISIEGLKFKVDYNYEDLTISNFTSYERHVIWRYEYLNIGPEQVSKKDKEILKKYFLGAKTLARKEHYDSGIYIQDIENMVAYSTDNYDDSQDEEKEEPRKQKSKNQILSMQEETRKIKFEK